MTQKNPCAQRSQFFYVNIHRQKLPLKGLLTALARYGISTAMIFLLCSPCLAESFITETSYFTRASCIKESGQCTMANGKELQDYGRNIAASWDYRLGQRIRVSCGNRSIICKVEDRGPARRLYRKGRRLDLNKQAFEYLAPIKSGLAIVTVEGVK